MNKMGNYDKKVDKIVLVVNGTILGVANEDDDKPIEKLLDILICEEFYKYNLDKEDENGKALLEYFEKVEKRK